MEITRKTFERNTEEAIENAINNIKAWVAKGDLHNKVMDKICKLKVSDFSYTGQAKLDVVCTCIEADIDLLKEYDTKLDWNEWFNLNIQPNGNIKIIHTYSGFHLYYYHSEMDKSIQNEPKESWSKRLFNISSRGVK
jgi:hypothetical protein